LKKQLMATTALVVASALATSGAALAQKKSSRPSLSIGGWYEAVLGAVDDNENGANGQHIGFDVHHDSEVHFKGSAKLDNGIRIRTRMEIETDTDNAGGVDESYVNISGGFGQLRLGAEDGAGHLLTTGTLGHWATNVASSLAFETQKWIDPPAGHAAGAVNRLDIGGGDDSKLTYFTPRIEGLTLGVSYMPSFQGNNNSAPESVSSNEFEGYQAALRYQRKFGKAAITVAAGYASIHEQGDGRNQERPGGFAGGIIIDYGNFRGSFGYTHEWNLTAETAATNGGNESFDTGIRYRMGRNHFSLGYMDVENEGLRANEANDTTNMGMLSYRRDLGPGVQYRLNFMWADHEGEVVGSTDDNDGVALTTGIRVAF